MTLLDGPIEDEPKGRVARKRELVKLRLIQAGMRLIGTHGVDQMSVAELTEMADCSVGAFYTHFETKDQFLNDLVSETIHPVAELLFRNAETEADARVVLAKSIRFCLELALQNKVWGWFFAAMAASQPHFTDDFGRGILNELKRGVRDNVFEIDDFSAAQAMVNGIFIGGVLAIRSGKFSENSVEKSVIHVLRAFGVAKGEAKRLAKVKPPEADFIFLSKPDRASHQTL